MQTKIRNRVRESVGTRGVLIRRSVPKLAESGKASWRKLTASSLRPKCWKQVKQVTWSESQPVCEQQAWTWSWSSSLPDPIVWLSFQVPTSGLELGPAGDRSGSRGEQDRGRVSRALRLPDVTMGLGQRLREETQPGWHWLSCLDWRACPPLVSRSLQTRLCCLLWAIDKRSSQTPAARCWGARGVGAKHVAWIFSEQGLFEAASYRLTPSSKSKSQAPWLHGRWLRPWRWRWGGRMRTTSGPVGTLQGLIITHQDTPVWSEFWRRKKQQRIITI